MRRFIVATFITTALTLASTQALAFGNLTPAQATTDSSEYTRTGIASGFDGIFTPAIKSDIQNIAQANSTTDAESAAQIQPAAGDTTPTETTTEDASAE